MLKLNSLLMAAALGCALVSRPALADLAPLDACSASEVGKPCRSALVNDAPDQPGVCVSTTCQRATPNGAMSYPCYRCEASPESGAGGKASVETTGGRGGAAGSSPAGVRSGGGGGCSVSAMPGGLLTLGGIVLALGVALGLRRQSSKPR